MNKAWEQAESRGKGDAAGGKSGHFRCQYMLVKLWINGTTSTRCYRMDLSTQIWLRVEIVLRITQNISVGKSSGDTLYVVIWSTGSGQMWWSTIPNLGSLPKERWTLNSVPLEINSGLEKSPNPRQATRPLRRDKHAESQQEQMLCREVGSWRSKNIQHLGRGKRVQMTY